MTLPRDEGSVLAVPDQDLPSRQDLLDNQLVNGRTWLAAGPHLVDRHAQGPGGPGADVFLLGAAGQDLAQRRPGGVLRKTLETYGIDNRARGLAAGAFHFTGRPPHRRAPLG